MELENTQNNALAKLPMLKLGEYEMWEIRIKQLAILGVVTPPEDLNVKFLRVPSEWDTHVVKVKKSAGASNDDKNLAFVTTSGASSTNNINTVNPEVSTATTKVNTASTETCTASFSDATVYAFLSTQPKGSQLVHEDLEQLHDDDLEEMDLKWNMALLSMRKKFSIRELEGKSSLMEAILLDMINQRNWNQGSSTKTVKIKDASEKAMCAIDGAGFDWSDMAEEEIQANMALMAFSDSEHEVLFSEEIALLKRSVGCKEYELGLLRTKLEKVKQEKEGVDFKIVKFDKSAKDLNEMLESQITDKSKKGVEFKELRLMSMVPMDSSLKPTLVVIKIESVNQIEKPVKRTVRYADKSLVKEQESQVKSSFVEGCGSNTSKNVSEVEPKKVRKNNDAPIIEDWVLDDEEQDGSKTKSEKKTVIPTAAKIEKPVRKPVKYAEMYSCPNQQRKRIVSGNNYNKKDNDYYSKTSHPSAHKHMAPRAVLMKTGLKSFNTARPVNIVRSVNTGRPFSTASYALTKKPKIYVSFIKQFWRTAEASTNTDGKVTITAIIDGQSRLSLKALLMKTSQAGRSDGITSIPSQRILSSLHHGVFSNMRRLTKGYTWVEIRLFPTMLTSPTPSSLPLRITSAPSLSSEPSTAPTFEPQPSPDVEYHVSSPNESPLHIGVFEDDLKRTKQTYSAAFTKLILRIKKLESKVKTGKARKRARVMLLEDEEDDSSKQGRIDEEPNTTFINTAGKETRNYKGKAIMTEPEPEKKSKKLLEQETGFRRTLDEERATSEPKTTKDIDWNDPSVQKYWDLKNKPKSEAQARKNMIVYLKNQSNYKMKDFEGMSYDEIRPIFEKVWDFNHNFVPMDLEIEKEKKKPAEFQEIEEEQIEKDTSKKTTGKRKKYLPRRRTRSTAKKQKVEQDDEKEELKNYLDIVPREDVAVDVESLSTKYPIVDWKTYTLSENFMYYKIIRGDGSSKNYKILSEMLYDFDRQDVVELYRLVKERYSSSKPEGYDLMLWGDLHTLFEPDEESEIWMNQNEYNLISWSLCDFCGVHILLMQNGIAIHMLTEKKYPLSQEMISKMLSKRLEVDQESTQAYELLKFIRSQVKK
ncbi:hypothetical protein Tco_0968020 [Tanacetum coccineum]